MNTKVTAVNEDAELSCGWSITGKLQGTKKRVSLAIRRRYQFEISSFSLFDTKIKQQRYDGV
jgi:hypothetical protein